MEDVPWRAVHREALDKGEMSYIDPATGYTAFTELSHLDRGYCCGNTCRHCPYSYENVGHPERIKEQARARRQEKKDARDRKRQQTTQDGKDGKDEEEESTDIAAATEGKKMIDRAAVIAALKSRYGVRLRDRWLDACAAHLDATLPQQQQQQPGHTAPLHVEAQVRLVFEQLLHSEISDSCVPVLATGGGSGPSVLPQDGARDVLLQIQEIVDVGVS
ncbi:hypothetical protein LPJ53_006428, partial [Coemansia erecta]